MLTAATIKAVITDALSYWKSEVRKSVIIGIAQGKEIGHKLADMVDEKTTALLTLNYIVYHQMGRGGKARQRSMGDCWLMENGIYHPINIKTSVTESGGSPNLVSLKKLMSAIMARQIDSYYILMVKMKIDNNGIAPDVYFFDLLDWLDYVSFDSGPGQMMLHASKFFSDYDSTPRESVNIREKLTCLMRLYEDGERRLRENRASDLRAYRRQFDAFVQSEEFSINAETQRSLNLAAGGKK